MANAMDELQKFVDAHLDGDWEVREVWDAFPYDPETVKLTQDEIRAVSQARASRTHRFEIVQKGSE